MIEDRQNAKASAMDKLSFHNPVFSTYAVAARIMILKAVMMSWLTVARMMQVKGGVSLARGHQKDDPQSRSKLRTTGTQ
jgi:hypothetical protein